MLGLLSTSNVGLKILVVLSCAAACLAQQHELGGAIGYGVYRDVSVISPGETATAGIRNQAHGRKARLRPYFAVGVGATPLFGVSYVF